MTSNHTDRQLKILSLKDISDQELQKMLLDPQLLIISGENTDGSRFEIDLGRVCYLVRDKELGNHYHKSEDYITAPVNTTSLSVVRILWLKNYLNVVLSKGWRSETIRTELYTLRVFFNHCDFSGFKPTDLESLLNEYRSFEIELYQRAKLNNEYSLSDSTIKKRLTTARNFVKHAFSLSEMELLQKIPKPRNTRLSNSSDIETVSLEEGKVYLQACIGYFNQFADAILNNSYPVHVYHPIIESENLYWHAARGTRLKELPNCFNQKGVPLDYSLIGKTIAKNFNGKMERSFYDRTLINNRNDWINGLLTIQKVYAFNLSVYCFFHIYLGFTGSNVQPTLDLKLSDLDLDKIGISGFAKKYKNRANRKIEFTAPSHLKRELIKFLKLRDWANSLNLDTDHDEDYLFLKISEKHTLKRLSRGAGDSLIKNSPLFEGITKVSSRELRRISGEYFVRESKGKVSLVAKKLNNSIATTSKHYTSINLESQAIEINEFHSQLSSKIRMFDRVTNEPIPISLDRNETTAKIAAGRCNITSDSLPKRAFGFNNEAPEPSCHIFESCLYCKYYALHVDFEDIHKLLSLREAISKTSIIRNDSEHYQAVIAPILYRIDEILSYLNENSSELDARQLIDEVKDNIEMGIYSSRWSEYIKALNVKTTMVI